jgi:uncharacterized iron-regulated protein
VALSISSPNPLLASDKSEPVKRDIFGSVSYEKALEAARKDKKTLFVLLTMYGCPWSGRLKAETLNDEKVQRLLKDTTHCVQIDCTVDFPPIVKTWEIMAYPTMIFLGGDEKVLGRLVGFRDANQFLTEAGDILKKAPAAVNPPKHHTEPPVITEKHFSIYDAKGNPATLDALLERLQSASVVFIGENHDDPVAHHLEHLLLKRLHEQSKRMVELPRPVALAVEMFERDVQDIVDEYLTGLITEAQFKAASRPWKNYDKDYRPMVEYARENKLPVLASNAPRRYVNRVGRLGAASLKDIPDPAKRGLPPLPYAGASPAYTAKFTNLMKTMHASEPKKDPPKKDDPKKDEPKKEESKKPVQEHNAARGLEAQSLWDASMAYTIAEFLLRQPRAQVVHVNGSFHSEQRMGIPEHLLRYRPGSSLVVVTIVPHKGFPKFDVGEMTDKGDFVIVADAALPRSDQSAPPMEKK